MAILGLDIGSDTIKMVEMQRKGRSYVLRNYAITPTPPNAVVGGDVQEPELVGEEVRAARRSRGLKSSGVVSSVQGQQSVVVRIIEIPRMSKGELADTMKFEVERHIPFPASQVIMDYAVLDRPGEPDDSPQMEVLFAAVQEETVVRHIDALREAKLKPKAIDVQPLALSHALVEVPEEGGLGATVAVVNIGASGTDLSIIKDGVLHFPRFIPIGGHSLTQRLSEGLAVSEQQAEEMKRRFATMRPLPPELIAQREQEAAQQAEAVETEPTFLDIGDVFDFDTETSDTGFGGSGTGHLSFEETETPAEEQEQPVELEDTAAEGPTFDFGFEDTQGDESPGDESAAEPELRLGPADEGEPFPARAEGEPGEGQGLVFGELAGGDEVRFDDEPEASEPEDSTFDFSLTEEPEPAAPAEDDAFDFSVGSVEGSAPGAAAEEEAGDFDFSLADESATGAAESTDFDFSLTEEEPSGQAAAPGDEAADDFDFSLTEDEGSSVQPDEPAPGPGTEVGTSFDLGDLASRDDEAGDDAAADYDFDFDETPAVATAPPAPRRESPLSRMEPIAADDTDRLRVREVVEPVVRELAGEIGRSLEYYRSRYEGAVVDRVSLVGGTARIEGLAEFLEEELGLPVDYGDPLRGVVVGNSKLSDEDLQRDAPLLSVAIGLALRNLAG